LRGIVIVERMILKLILKTQEVRYGLDSAGSGGGPVVGFVITVINLRVP